MDQSKGDFAKNSSWNKQREPQRALIDICICNLQHLVALFFQDCSVLLSPSKVMNEFFRNFPAMTARIPPLPDA